MSRDRERLRREFVAEAETLLEDGARTLDRMEEGNAEPDPALVNEIFRSVHSLKGLAGMTGFPALAESAHGLEALLGALRMGKVPFDTTTREAAREALSALQALVARVIQGESDPDVPAVVRDHLGRALEARAAEVRPAVAVPPEVANLLTEYERHRLEENVRKGRRVVFLTLDLPFETFDESLRNAMAEAAKAGEHIGTLPGSASDPTRMTFRLLVATAPEVDAAGLAKVCGANAVEVIAEAPAPPKHEEPPDERRDLRVGTVRVPVEKISSLLDLAGELALSLRFLNRSLGAEPPGSRQHREKALSDLDRAVTALGRAALALRLVPVDQLAERLSRGAVSIAKRLGKEAEFEVVGGETEIDKVVADQLADPFLHMVRNSLDHGIEPPAERAAKGKRRQGLIQLRAAARGREVVLTLSDDGRGVDPQAIVQHARRRGLLASDAPRPQDPLSLLFLPGFSTAAEISDLSGRGVGLDVVRSNIESLKGRVRVRSTLGAGTEFEIVVPMTLALVESLLVRAGAGVFALPAASVVEAYLEDGARAGLRVVPLESLLGLPSTGSHEGSAIVVAEHGSRRVGFRVSAIEGLRDVVVRPLSSEVPRALEVIGAAELPDGDLVLTLDAGRLVERALS